MPPKKRVTKKTVPEDSVAPDVPHEVVAPAEPEAANHQPIILQLPIAPSRLEEIMESTNLHGILEYNPNIVDPQPYIPDDTFQSNNDTIVSKRMEEGEATDEPSDPDACDDVTKSHVSHGCACYWCCHSIPHIEYGMPIRYDVFHKSFTLFGSFCSLECAAAYNFSTHMGSDRVWEIHSWIQMLAHRYGYQEHVRPAPPRYLLKMFNGPLSIDEFRETHKGLARTYMMNIPPFIHVVSQMEVLNTSFLESSDAKKTKRATKGKAVSVFGGAEPVSPT